MSNQDNPNQPNQPPAIAGAITYPQSSSVINENVPQPRQPHTLQGLLRFCMEATKAEDAPGESILGPMDEERRKFLEEALKSLTVDVIEVLLQAIKKLRGAANLSVDSDITEYLNAFENILDLVDHIDTAIDFHKIGGYEIFEPCFNSVHAPIRANACNVLAELCQNNPYCQERALEHGFIKTLLDLIDTDIDEAVTIKALYALSCLTREHEKSLLEFRKQNGISVLMRALHKPVIKIRIKVCFLLSTLCSRNKDIKNDLINVGFIQLFISLLTEDRNELHEHILSALLCLVRDNEVAIAECRKEEYGLESILNNYLRLIENHPEAVEEKEYCRELLNIIFSNEVSTVER